MQLQSTKAQLQHAEASTLQTQQQILGAESLAKTQQHSAEVAEEQCRQLRWAHLHMSVCHFAAVPVYNVWQPCAIAGTVDVVRLS